MESCAQLYSSTQRLIVLYDAATEVTAIRIVIKTSVIVNEFCRWQKLKTTVLAHLLQRGVARFLTSGLTLTLTLTLI